MSLKTLRKVEIPYVVLEINPVTVREQRKSGEPIMFGDCGRDSVLEHAGITAQGARAGDFRSSYHTPRDAKSPAT